LKGNDCLDVHSLGGPNLICAVQDSYDSGFSEYVYISFIDHNILVYFFHLIGTKEACDVIVWRKSPTLIILDCHCSFCIGSCFVWSTQMIFCVFCVCFVINSSVHWLLFRAIGFLEVAVSLSISISSLFQLCVYDKLKFFMMSLYIFDFMIVDLI
jgi:hypothetical protein